MALAIALGAEILGTAVALAMFSDPLPAPPPVYGGQAAVYAQNGTGRTLGHYQGAHARQGRHGHPGVAPATGGHSTTARHRATVTA